MTRLIEAKLRKNRVGLESGRLRVTSYAYSTVGVDETQRVHFYNCECACGNHVVVRINNLLSKNTRSCGCMRVGRKVTKKEKVDVD